MLRTEVGAGGVLAEVRYETLTPRELHVLRAIGRRLSNPEIAAELVLSIRTVESHVAALRRKLDVDSRPALVRAGQARVSNAVTLPPNALVGRTADLAAIHALLQRNRLVTITGSAGCGKTRLAREVAAQHALAPILVELDRTDPRTVLAAIAGAVGVRAEAESDLIAGCVVVLDAGGHLVVLDNCDRVTGAVASTITMLLARIPSLRVLTTSRSPIGVGGEAIHTLEPLPTDATARDGAVRLFLDRSATAAPDVDLGSDATELIARICRRIDGLPLAIELAAARVRHLGLAELASMLDERIDVLGDPSGEHRHRTLDAAFAWSWDMLADEERILLSALAALPRSFDLALAAEVGGPGAGRIVVRLLDRSLLAPASGATQRFRLLEALRTFVLDRTQPDTVTAVRRAHTTHHLDLAEQLAGSIRTDDNVETAERWRGRTAESTAALVWSTDHVPPDARRLAAAMAMIVEQVGPDVAALAAIADAARSPQVRDLMTAADLFVIGTALAPYSFALAEELATLALDRADDPASAMAAHHLVGFAHRHRSLPAALDHLERAERLAIELDDRWWHAYILQTRASVQWTLRAADPVEVLAIYAASAEGFARAGDAMHVNNTRFLMARTAAEAGIRRDDAIAWAEQSITYSRDRGQAQELAHAQLTLAALSQKPERADLVEAALETFRAVGDLRCVTRAHMLLAEDAPARDAVILLSHALDVTIAAGDRPLQIDVLTRLIQAHWRCGAVRDAALATGMLTELAGADAATRACPAELAAQLDRWKWVIEEGRARAAPAARRG